MAWLASIVAISGIVMVGVMFVFCFMGLRLAYFQYIFGNYVTSLFNVAIAALYLVCAYFCYTASSIAIEYLSS